VLDDLEYDEGECLPSAWCRQACGGKTSRTTYRSRTTPLLGADGTRH
jgi:hypothetical protein